MFLTLTSTAPQATDLGHLLHKHPDRVQSFEVPMGTAHVYYPEAGETRCTVALLVEVDPIQLVRKGSSGSGVLGHYVNDRPYAASSLLAGAIGHVFRSALNGRCTARPELVDQVLPLAVRVPVVPAPDLVHRLFGPLGWQVQSVAAPLDPDVPDWGAAPYLDLLLTGEQTLADALGHLCVLLPVLDDARHHWVGADQVDQLVRRAGSWLPQHPERELITRRYLVHQRGYVHDAGAALNALDDTTTPVRELAAENLALAPEPEPPRPLRRQRQDAVLAALLETGAARVVDVGCGEGALLEALLEHPRFVEVVGVDVSARELDRAARRLGPDRIAERQRARLTIRQSSVTYRDRSLEGYDALVLMEVIEHVEPDRLPDLERAVFGHARPGAVVVTTPNADYNPRYPGLAAGALRHPDHRFEWTRGQFAQWAQGVAQRHRYAVDLRPVGEVDPGLGPPTQLALFTRTDRAGVVGGTGEGSQ